MIVASRMVLDRRRATLWWLLGILVLVIFTVALYPAVKGQGQVEDLLEGMPEAFKNMVGYDAGVPLTSPAGYLHARLFSTVAPVLLRHPLVLVSATQYARPRRAPSRDHHTPDYLRTSLRRRILRIPTPGSAIDTSSAHSARRTTQNPSHVKREA